MFDSAVQRIINTHGVSAIYNRTTEGTYDIESGSATNSVTSHSIKTYMKHMRSNQYNFPNLIGKEVGLFYIYADSIPFVPEVQDSIVYNSRQYKVDSVQSHSANGSIVLYRLVGVI